MIFEFVTTARLTVGVVYSMFAGALNGGIAIAIGSSFSQQLFISVTTGMISFAGIVIAAVIAAKAAHESRELAAANAQTLAQHSEWLSDIQHAQGTANRRTDHIDERRHRLRAQIGDDAGDAQDKTDAALEHEREDG